MQFAFVSSTDTTVSRNNGINLTQQLISARGMARNYNIIFLYSIYKISYSYTFYVTNTKVLNEKYCLHIKYLSLFQIKLIFNFEFSDHA